MNRDEVLPYYYPSTVLFVDDNRGYLNHISLKLDDQLLYQFCGSVPEALSYINKLSNRTFLSERSIEKLNNFQDLSQNEIVCLMLNKFKDEIYNHQRFSEISVVITDYEMPGVNGLEFCQQIKSNPIKKILLTGIAGEKEAINAFNMGNIDRYISKNEPNAYELINKAIFELQYQYFADVTKSLAKILAVDSQHFIHDPAFSEFFDKLYSKYNIVEHYLSKNPGGIFFVDRSGKTFLLLMQTDEDLKTHWEIASSEDAPDRLLRQLAKCSAIPYFWKSEGYYRKECGTWGNFLYPAKNLKGNKNYYYAIIDNPPLNNPQPRKIITYNQYRETISTQNNDPTLH